MNSELHFKHITLSNRYGHVYTLAHTLSRRRKMLSSFLVMLHMAYIKKCEKCINDMRLFYDKNIFSNKWVIKWDLHFIERYFHLLYSVIFRYVSMWVGVFACVIGVDVLETFIPVCSRRHSVDSYKSCCNDFSSFQCTAHVVAIELYRRRVNIHFNFYTFYTDIKHHII